MWEDIKKKKKTLFTWATGQTWQNNRLMRTIMWTKNNRMRNIMRTRRKKKEREENLE